MAQESANPVPKQALPLVGHVLEPSGLSLDDPIDLPIGHSRAVPVQSRGAGRSPFATRARSSCERGGALHVADPEDAHRVPFRPNDSSRPSALPAGTPAPTPSPLRTVSAPHR